MKRFVIAALLACLAPLSRAHADYALVCTPSNGGAPTAVTLRGASGFDDACRAIAANGRFTSCIDGQGQRGACPAVGGRRTLTMRDIVNNAAASTCASYDWQGQGQARSGYISGIALSYALAVCRVRAGAVGADAIMAGPLGDQSRDALAWYQAQDKAVISNPLRDVYTLALGEGMLESSGNPTKGWYTNKSAEEAEAGLFQVSYNSFNTHPVLKGLWDAYHETPEACWFNIFMQGSEDEGRDPVGEPDEIAAEFQTFTKQCPSFALEYALVLFRVKRQHFGPINRLEAEFRPECTAMLTQIEDTVTCP